MADPFEEFEFKPLTEGLGFHKKNRRSEAPAEIPLVSRGLDILEDSDSPLRPPPLPRENSLETRSRFVTEEPIDDSSAAVEEILQTLRTKKTEKAPANVVAKAKAPIRYASSIQNINAFFLDSMLIIAASLLCMIVVLSITKLDVGSALFNSINGLGLYVSSASLFALVTFIYLVVHRIFLGATPGEWAYDQRIGSPEELGTARYALTVTLRGLIIVATGIIPLALVSMILKRDLVGELSGTQLLERA